MKVFHSRAAALASAALLSLGLAAPAQAATYSLTVGPIPLTPVPFEFCLGLKCVRTPGLGDARLTVEVTPNELDGVTPSIHPAACPAGQLGSALVVKVGRDALVGGLVTGRINGISYRHAIDPVMLGANRTIVLSLCTF